MRHLLPAALLLLTASCTSAFTGPVGIDPERRGFVDAGGRRCYWLGDTEWELFRTFREGEARILLDDRKAKGFNALQVMLLGVGGGVKPNVHGAKPFLNDSVATPNEAYFAPIDPILRMAEERGIVLVIGIYHKGPDTGTMITKENARAWGAWIGRRFKDAPNVIWSSYPVANASYVAIERELAAGLAEGDGGRHLITVHPDPSPASSSWIHEEPWLAFNSLQTFRSDFLNYSMVAADYQRTPAKPVVNAEARYEDEDRTTPQDVRRGAWWSCLAGGFYSYGHGGNWMKPAAWKTWLDSPGSRQMKVLGDFFRELDWWTLVPDPGLLPPDAGKAAAARSSLGTWAVVYFPTPKAVTLDLRTLKGPTVSTWVHPATGERVPGPEYSSAESRHVTPPEGWPDAVLLLRIR